mmetsp:Transcript_97231/g.275468  ORF Transcript_97231/g.275468 Transcript_97231/m.275468 type:complete len:174 (+) Transcript_97231:81-602(+)
MGPSSACARAAALTGLLLSCGLGEAARSQGVQEAGEASSSGGVPCTGKKGGFWSALTASSCAKPPSLDEGRQPITLNYKCLRAPAWGKAGEGEQGTCYIRRHDPCRQAQYRVESSGDCVPGLVCRAFAYTKEEFRHRLERVQYKRSFCVSPEDPSDNALKFLGGVIYDVSVVQ